MLTYDDWRAQWGPQRELQTALGEVRWRTTIHRRPVFHAARAEEFALDESLPAQRAVGGAADGGNVGLSLAELPTPSATVVSATDDDQTPASLGSR